MQRDMEEFSNYGYSMETASQLDGQINAFEELPTDEELEGDTMIATEKKNEVANETRELVRKIMVRVQSKFGKRSAYYKKFGASSLSRLTDEKLIRTARRVARVATIYQEELIQTGLQQQHIDVLKNKADEFDLNLEEQDDAVADREIGTLLRVRTAEDIYNQISMICDTGKEIWKGRNEAKYNDYVIYDTPTGKPEEEETDL